MEMTTYERVKRTYEHKEVDRVPIWDSPWKGTIKRWEREGMPKGMDYRDYFGIDKMATVGVDISPQYEEKVIEETDDYVIKTTPWGVTLKNFKELDSTPEFLDFKVTTPEAWEEAKKRMQNVAERINWKDIDERFTKYRSEGQWVRGTFWFGFDVTHSWMAGTETILMAMCLEPDWVVDMFNHYLDCSIEYMDALFDKGYKIDEMFWYDDMGYKNTTFFSLDMYRELLKPVHKRAIDWAKSKGIYSHLHSCGYVRPFVPDLVDIGVDALNPIEIKAGMDVLELKREFGDKLVLHGGIDALLWNDKERMQATIKEQLPILKENGGYIFATDHSIPNNVTLQDFKEVVDIIKNI